ncbi:HIRA-interacting protein 3 [Myotis brandtii]|uniref:HIRA-interacting protein 3 n=1 Tax=Myotis brandtii TaxID=109478 RepID=S7NM79_MYOBR|nr:PREDICTED: HIRA-interacting protein 3 [Myotis brandtii]EPQ17520.1 HIRA-interacting protein 3 [Myotis brandtii]
MARENELREFTRSFFRGRPDLSTLTHSIVRRRFLAHTGRDHLDPKEKQALKRLVEEELLKMQGDEAGAREGLDLAKKAKRPPTSCSDPERKRFRLNSDSEPSAAASSPDCSSHPAKNGMGGVASPTEESPKRASKRAIESSDEEEQQRDLTAYKTGLEEEAVKESWKEEEEESSARTSKVWKEESSEEGNKEKESKGRTRKKRVTKNRTQRDGGKRQSGSSKEDGEDSWRKLKPATKGMGKSAKVESRKTTNGEASDSEREVSDTEAGGTLKGERKNCSYRKSSKKSRPRSSSSSSANGSPEPRGRKVRMKMGWEATIKNKQVPDKISASRKQAMESEDSEEEPAQRMENKRAKRHQESEMESEGEETLAKKENREEDWKPRAPNNGGKKSAWEERSSKQKSLAAKVLGDWEDREEEKEKAAAGSGDNSGGDEEPLVQRKGKNRTQRDGGKRQSGSSKEDGEDSWRKLKPATKGMGKSAKVESRKTTNGEASDSEREVSDSEAGGTLKGERKNRSYRKSSKKSRSRSSSSSSANGSPEPRGRKSGHRDEDHPAVMRLKRYIRACGAHRNYKKLLGSCRSRKERLCVLRAELEALGMKGNPSLEKCRALKEQREEAAEVASLDITNIISCSGRPRRRTAWNPSEAAPPGELYRRTLDSEEERHCAPRPDWSHMRGIISSDGESN